jgi:hypothetical protein
MVLCLVKHRDKFIVTYAKNFNKCKETSLGSENRVSKIHLDQKYK